jgi:hypothetical protein
MLAAAVSMVTAAVLDGRGHIGSASSGQPEPKA